MLTVGSLFSGIGGLDLGLERAGMRVIWQAEIDPFCCKVLKKHWPDVPNMGNVTKLDWKTVSYVDLIVGGYPCQPFSNAGKRRGENDPRHLWPVMFNAICNLRPRYALMENVRGHLSMGFGTVLGDLARIGFNAQWQVLPASAFGAPHRRDRVFIVAYTASKQGNGGRNGYVFGSCATDWLQSPIGRKSGNEWKSKWETEPNVGRVANGVPNRVDRLRGLGNAVVPQVAEFIGSLINEHAKQFQ